MAYLTVKEIVEQTLIEENKVTDHEFMRYVTIANRGLKELSYDILGNTKITLVVADESLRVDLPVDFVDYSFIGVVGNDGTLRPLGRKANIPLVGTTNVKSSDSESHGIINLREVQFGQGGGQNSNGYYSPEIDRENWQMVFTSMEIGKTIYIEYISDGSSEYGEAIVHPYAEEALIAWILWKSIRSRRGATINDREMARRDWYNEKRLAKARLSAFTKEEALQQIRTGFKQSPKA